MIFKVLVLISVKIRFHSFVFCRTKIVEKIVSFMSVLCMSYSMVYLFRSGNRLNICEIYFYIISILLLRTLFIVKANGLSEQMPEK